MRLHEVSLTDSPLSPARVRLTGRYRFGPGQSRGDELWFEVPRELVGGLGTSGNPWLAALLPMAVTLQEPLELCLPVDPALHEGAIALMQTWSGAYPDRAYAPIDLVADISPHSVPSPASRTVQFFTCGVDSFFTLLRHRPEGNAIDRRQIDDLLTIHGFDIPLDETDAFRRLAHRVASVADSLGLATVTIVTTLRESSWRRTHWGEIGQGPAMAAMALTLERRYQHALLPASVCYDVYLPYGTHPLFDPLLSTTSLRFENDGGRWTRMAKLSAIAGSALAMSQLRVCWEGRSDRNCGHCEKCLRTLALLEMLGAPDAGRVFPEGSWDLQALAALRLRNSTACWSMNALARHAAAEGRADIARAAQRAVARFQRRQKLATIRNWFRPRAD